MVETLKDQLSLGKWESVAGDKLEWHRSSGKIKLKSVDNRYRIVFKDDYNDYEESLGPIEKDHIEEELYAFVEDINEKYY